MLAIGLRADQVLASDAFGLYTSRNPGSEDDMARYVELLGKEPRAEAEGADASSTSSSPETRRIEEDRPRPARHQDLATLARRLRQHQASQHSRDTLK